LLGLALVIAVGLGVVWIIQTAKQNQGGPEAAPQGLQPATVTVTAVERIAAQEHYTVTGDLRAVARAEVAAREAGAVNDVPVNEGDKVRKGDVLVRLDPRRLDAGRAEAEAQIAAAKSLVTQREADRDRTEQDLKMKEPLLEKRAISKRELLDAEQAFAVANAAQVAATESLREATSRMTLLDIRYKDLVIIAPFDGRVASRHVEKGEWVVPGQAVVTLVSVGTIEAWLQVPERFAADVATYSNNIEVFVTALGETVPSQNVKIVPDIDTATRIFPVIVTLDSSAGRLAPGMSIRARIPVGANDPKLAVPVDAVVYGHMGQSIFKVGPSASADSLPPAVRVAVEILFEDGGLAFVSAEDLTENDRVVIEGNQRLLPGTPLITHPLQPKRSAVLKE
jgi:RND family efflux transporter MFP subunit